jgi:hypothetical protein
MCDSYRDVLGDGGNIYGCVAATHGDCHPVKKSRQKRPAGGQNYRKRPLLCMTTANYLILRFKFDYLARIKPIICDKFRWCG